MIVNEKINDKLKDIIARNFDAYQGYQNAAENVENEHLASILRSEATQRKNFAVELENEAHVYDYDTRKQLEEGTFKGTMHRGWMDMKTALSSNKDEAVLEECIRGEKAALEEYNTLIEEGEIKGQPHHVISQQRNNLQTTISQLERLETLAG